MGGRASRRCRTCSAEARAGALTYFAFDLSRLDGEDLGRRPLLERKARPAALLERAARDADPPSQHWPEDGEAVFREACRLGLEGIVSKRADAAYRPGRNTDWVKVKCLRRQELVIGGFTEPEGAARTGLGALLVGYHEGERLGFAGKVGTGFTNASATALRKRARRPRGRRRARSRPRAGALGRLAHWVRPELVAEVAFSEWTGTEDPAPELPGPPRGQGPGRRGARDAGARAPDAPLPGRAHDLRRGRAADPSRRRGGPCARGAAAGREASASRTRSASSTPTPGSPSSTSSATTTRSRARSCRTSGAAR